MNDQRSCLYFQRLGFGLRGGVRLVALDRRLYLVAGLNQVLHEGGEFHGAVNLARGDDRADAAASCQEAAVDETLQGLARGWA